MLYILDTLTYRERSDLNVHANQNFECVFADIVILVLVLRLSVPSIAHLTRILMLS